MLTFGLLLLLLGLLFVAVTVVSLVGLFVYLRNNRMR